MEEAVWSFASSLCFLFTVRTLDSRYVFFRFSTSTFWREIQGAVKCRRGACFLWLCSFSAVGTGVNFSKLAVGYQRLSTLVERKKGKVGLVGEQREEHRGVIRGYVSGMSDGG